MMFVPDEYPKFTFQAVHRFVQGIWYWAKNDYPFEDDQRERINSFIELILRAYGTPVQDYWRIFFP